MFLDFQNLLFKFENILNYWVTQLMVEALHCSLLFIVYQFRTSLNLEPAHKRSCWTTSSVYVVIPLLLSLFIKSGHHVCKDIKKNYSLRWVSTVSVISSYTLHIIIRQCPYNLNLINYECGRYCCFSMFRGVLLW